ncbi:nitroreductase [Sneathiella sp. P13V-1]|uniref:nitroreductase family protein n=1 Tax=Sneathiella sp. P13V-1 TaxID=2697366 RepID=UPI00187BA559|nr:nitroreductase family protein [Sneathiella sp. P13V-1]MBE7638111.1 nitroreductase [Sneathiella sp. P13V-1]
MDAIEALLTRKSTALLEAPAPAGDDLEKILKAALRAPDHACLRPWRIILFKDDARHELGQIYAEALKKKDVDASDAALEKELKKPLRAPLVIAVIAKIQDHPKIPQSEQLLSAGAAAQNIMLASHALGFGGIWRSGDICFDETVKTRLGATGLDEIIGFLYLGTPKSHPPIPEFEMSDHIQEWKSV